MCSLNLSFFYTSYPIYFFLCYFICLCSLPLTFLYFLSIFFSDLPFTFHFFFFHSLFIYFLLLFTFPPIALRVCLLLTSGCTFYFLRRWLSTLFQLLLFFPSLPLTFNILPQLSWLPALHWLLTPNSLFIVAFTFNILCY